MQSRFTILVTIITVFLCVDSGIVAAKNTNSNVNFARTITLSACNAAPYVIEVVFLDLDGSTIAEIELSPGRCDDFEVSIPHNGAAVYGRARPSEALSRLNKYEFFRESWSGMPVFASGDSDIFACIENNSGIFKGFKQQSDCQYSEQSKELAYLSGDANEFRLFIDDPFICERISPTCAERNGAELLTWAYQLNRSLEASNRTWNVKDNTLGLIPFASGMETVDENGPFKRGILITKQQAEITPLGSPVPGKGGDIILTFNGEPIFDRDDFIALAIEHGKTHGYENPYTIEIDRRGNRFQTEGYLVFHRGVYGSFFVNSDGSCKNKTAAVLSGALEEATFYSKPILACVNFDINNMTVSRNRECEFAVRQLTAAYRQFCPELTFGSVLVGSVFMPGRKLAESMVKKLTVKNLGRIAPALIVEVAEEFARAVITLPPGIKAEDNWKSIGQQVGFGVSVGLGFNLITMK